MKFPLPPTFYFGAGKALTVGMFVQNTGWTDNGISSVVVEPKDMSVKFETSKLLPLSLLLPKCTDCPYRSFFLRCSSTEAALLDIESTGSVNGSTKRNQTSV